MFILAAPVFCRAGELVPDETQPPRSQSALAPVNGATVWVNPPSLIWKTDSRAASYVVELSPVVDFSRDVVRVADIPYAYYNHHTALAAGKWYWRYSFVAKEGQFSAPSSVKTFTISPATTALPIPVAKDLLAALPGHPRIFATPQTLAEFRARRTGAGQTAWEQVRLQAEEALKQPMVKPELQPLPEKFPPHRRQVFWVENGVASVPANYAMLDLLREADRANLLSFAYLISGDERYAEAAKGWALHVAHYRMDYHLKTIAERGQHDTVVYAYERGLKGIALVYDRLQAHLNAQEKRALLDHIEFHGEAAFHWIRDVMKLHVNYQDSHGQQCMHMLLTTALAIGGESKIADDWIAYMVPQYASRIPWMGEDGGYFEGQAYMFKLSYILEALAALRSATGVDLFQKPEIKHAGDFFLYCQSMNYWWPHWGDTMGLWFPFGNVGDAFMSALLATMTENRALQWWSNNVPADPTTPPFGYLAATGIVPQPPVAIPQARAFVPTGVVAAFDRHYDQDTTRLFFRSSPWGGESHAHADQNSFVIHSGGEILAADTGYYTYYGDENYNKVATQTLAHNSVLVGGKGQTNDIKGEGRITGYFNSPGFTFMAGDASKAYGSAMDFFRRDVLFIRPGVFIIADELRAPQPAEFTWMLNAFVAPKIDEAKRAFTVTENAETLSVQHVFPEKLRFDASNAKLTPRKTQVWTRFTEAFPEPWRIHATTEKVAHADMLTVLSTFDGQSTRDVKIVASQQNEHAAAVRLKTASNVATVVVRKRVADSSPYAMFGLNTDARLALLERDAKGQLVRWGAVDAKTLASEHAALFRASSTVSIASEATSLAERLITLSATQPTTVTLPLAHEPVAMKITQPAKLEAAQPLAMRWANGEVSFEIPAGESAVLIDPSPRLNTRPKTIPVVFSMKEKKQSVSFETAVAENGDWVAYATLTAQDSGIYEIAAGGNTEILVQDRWDPARSVRGHGKVKALVGDQTEVILRFPARAKLPKFTATLVEAIPLSQINLLRNGDCEVGLPGFPPRGWTVQNGTSSETYGVPGEQGWPGWTQESAASGKGALKFTRPINHSVDWRPPNPELARDQMVALAPPVRLSRSGNYVLSCKTKGTATTASVEIQSAAGVVTTIELAPSSEWETRRLEVTLPAGYTQVRVKFVKGGADDQLLWADDFMLTPAGN